MADARDPDDFCAALEAGDLASVRAQLARTPELAVHVLSDGWPVFLLQSVFPDPEIIGLLVAHGAHPDLRNPRGETLLHLTGDPAAIRRLVALGADIDARDHQGRTPMMAHAPYPETGPDAIFTLLAQGADPAIVDQNGQSLASLLPPDPRFAALRKI